MIKKISLAVSLAGLLSLVGCAATSNTTVFPMEQGTVKAITTSSDQNAALKDNLAEVEQYCQKQGKSYVVIAQKSSYEGMDKDIKKAANMASDVAFMTSNTLVPTSSLTSDTDNKVVTKFKCK
jgi:hypothetical protein